VEYLKVGQCSVSQRLNLSTLYGTAQLNKLHVAIQQMSRDPLWYSNPSNTASLPFMFISAKLPGQRFQFSLSGSTCVFEYMGRELFASVWKKVQGLCPQIKATELYVQGTKGVGKSHLLAVLALLLYLLGKRTVYIPDCREACKDPFVYIQSALLCAFADPASASTRAAIRAFRTTEDINDFCHTAVEPFYFIIDQIDALQCDDLNVDEIPKG
jgi:hypothetical protein